MGLFDCFFAAVGIVFIYYIVGNSGTVMGKSKTYQRRRRKIRDPIGSILAVMFLLAILSQCT
jgi:hypothetical protein